MPRARSNRWWDHHAHDLDVMRLVAYLCRAHEHKDLDTRLGNENVFAWCERYGYFDAIATATNEAIEYRGVLHCGDGLTVIFDEDAYREAHDPVWQYFHPAT